MPDYLIRFLGPLTIVAAMAASHPASHNALDAIGDQVATIWIQLVQTGDCVTPGGGSCMTPATFPSNARTASDRQISF